MLLLTLPLYHNHATCSKVHVCVWETGDSPRLCRRKPNLISSRTKSTSSPQRQAFILSWCFGFWSYTTNVFNSLTTFSTLQGYWFFSSRSSCHFYLSYIFLTIILSWNTFLFCEKYFTWSNQKWVLMQMWPHTCGCTRCSALYLPVLIVAY